MNHTITCQFCASTDVPADLECIGMCDRCCKDHVDGLVDGRGRLSLWMIKRVLRQQRELREWRASEEAETRAAIEGR